MGVCIYVPPSSVGVTGQYQDDTSLPAASKCCYHMRQQLEPGVCVPGRYQPAINLFCYHMRQQLAVVYQHGTSLPAASWCCYHMRQQLAVVNQDGACQPAAC
eukprot:gene13493-19352_t